MFYPKIVRVTLDLLLFINSIAKIKVTKIRKKKLLKSKITTLERLFFIFNTVKQEFLQLWCRMVRCFALESLVPRLIWRITRTEAYDFDN